MARKITLEELHLKHGGHLTRSKGMCVMEAVAYFAGEKHGDHPKCVSPVLGAFLRNWNDSVGDDFRQKLKVFIPRVIGTAGDGKDEVRAWMATDWLVRVCAPSWLDLAKLTQHATALRTAEQITNNQTAKTVQPVLDAARAAAWAAARATAWVAAWDAAGAAARAAAWVAAWDAAGVAARAAAWDAAGVAARAAAGDAAGVAARAAAGDAAWVAARAAAGAAARAAAGAAARAAAGDAAWAAARAAAGDAAGQTLKPTVEMLQVSALELLENMINPAMEVSSEEAR